MLSRTETRKAVCRQAFSRHHNAEANNGRTKRSTGSEDRDDRPPDEVILHHTLAQDGASGRLWVGWSLRQQKGKTATTPTSRMWKRQCGFTSGRRGSRLRPRSRRQQLSSSCSQPRLLPDDSVLGNRRIFTQAPTHAKKSQNGRVGWRFSQA